MTVSGEKIYMKTKFPFLKCNFFIKHILETKQKKNNNKKVKGHRQCWFKAPYPETQEANHQF